MSTRLYVGNLPFTVDEDALRALFVEAGHTPTDVAVVKDRETGRSRGFGFVTLASAGAAQEAANALNGKEFEGRALTVNEARERTGGGSGFRREGGFSGGGGGGGGGRGGGGGGGGRRGGRW
ncbi:MAG TPA: RNA-binding protein [Planctomycetota bacterium]|jgi:RNA recognition motif-containing protein|nr:RNA-binding protein [Planctomycetota bacterium]